MGTVFTNPLFDEWIRHIFDHDVAEPCWYFDVDADYVELTPERAVKFAVQLFENAGELLAPYTDEQANQGLWYLISESTSDLYALIDSAVPLSLRLRCIRAILSVFEQCFVPRCTPHLSHLDERGIGVLNGVCYMWWDILPLYGRPELAERAEIDATCLEVMEATLQLTSLACLESALHGLGHWSLYYEEKCRRIVSEFIGRSHNLRRELREYALRAKQGYIL